MLEEGELRIELSRPFLFSIEFRQEAVHIGDHHVVRFSAVMLGSAVGIDRNA